MSPPLPAHVLDALKTITTPTAANAIETFNVRPRNQGFMSPEIRCCFPEMEPMVGYAVTALIRAEQPAVEGHRVDPFAWWEHVLSVPAPRVLVMQDLDKPAGVGAFWGEVQANIHKALGCVGVVTDGSVRDLDEVRALGFHLFAAHVSVSHAYVHMVDFGVPVKVGGLVVNPGELVHADKHGVHTIPRDIADKLPEAAREIGRREQIMISAAQAPDFTLDKLKGAWKKFRAGN